MTDEQRKQKQVEATFHSVALVTELNAKEELTEDEVQTKARNIEHLALMMDKEWFIAAITQEQYNQIASIIW